MKRIASCLKDIMKRKTVSIEDAAKYTGVSLGTFRNKMTLDRFSVDDLIVIAEMCDYHLALVPHNVEGNNSIYILDMDEKTKMKIEQYRDDKINSRLDVLESYIKNMSQTERKELANRFLKD